MRIDLVLEKGVGEINEDNYCVNGNLYGVFDGASSLTPARFDNNLTGGYMASTLAARAFTSNGDSLINLTQKANTSIRDAMSEHGVDLRDKGGLWCTSAAVVRLNEDYFEWVQIGDSLIMVIYDDGRHELLVDDFDHDLETLKLWQTLSKTTNEGILKALAGKIMEVRTRQNVDYGVLNGEAEALSFLKSGRKSLRRASHILLFTDGFFIPKSDLEKRDDFSRLAELFLEGGLTRVKDVVREMERGDAGCRKYPRFKIHDDMAAIALTMI